MNTITDEQMRSWTPDQQIQVLTMLVEIVMAEHKEDVLILPNGFIIERKKGEFFLRKQTGEI